MAEIDARCPYCDRLRAPMGTGLLPTCGSPACAGRYRMVASRGWPRREGEIDFQNGFASQNLTFAPRVTGLVR